MVVIYLFNKKYTCVIIHLIKKKQLLIDLMYLKNPNKEQYISFCVVQQWYCRIKNSVWWPKRAANGLRRRCNDCNSSDICDSSF